MRFSRTGAAALLALCLTSPALANESDTLIWPRIVAGMRLVDNEQPDVQYWAARYARHPGSFQQMLARAEPFLWYIVEAVERRGLPAELALLPAVESGFDPQARSPQKAQGLWQFVPWTGRALGLQNTRDYDARRDPVASTEAALSYLESLHQRFGDWHLALAAYNVGSGRLATLLRAQPHAADFWSLKLPRETHTHVRRLMGVALLVEKPAQFGIELPPIANRHAAELIALERPINLRRAAEHAGVAEATIRTYNPGLHNLDNTTGKKLIILPTAAAMRLRTALSTSTFTPVPVPSVVVHVVKPGDSLWKIAQRYDVRVRDLTRHNGISEKTLIRPGRRLEVPIRSQPA